MQHTQEANESDGDEGSPLPAESNSDKGFKNRHRDHRPALAWFGVLPLAVNLPGRAKGLTHLRKAILSSSDRVDQDIPSSNKRRSQRPRGRGKKLLASITSKR